MAVTRRSPGSGGPRRLTVRLAGPADAAAIQGIYAPIVENTSVSFERSAPTVGAIRERIDAALPRHPWIVAETDGSVVGYAHAGPYRPRAAYAWSVETTVYVVDAARGTGVGRALYEVLLAGLRRQRFVTALAAIALPNDASVGLHEAVGFRPAGVFSSVGYKLGAWHDVGWWRAELVSPPPPAPPAPRTAEEAWYRRAVPDAGEDSPT